MNRLSVSDLIDLPTTNTIKEKDDTYVKEVADGEFALDMERIVADVLNSGARVAPDMRIDDRDLKEFPNFYEWCFSKDGGNQAPFAKQLALATHLLAEYCPRCTRKAFRNIHKIPVDFPAKDFPDKVQFLHYGVCPNCGARKSELVKSGELNAYIELDVCAGQRCITGDSLVLTQYGLTKFEELDDNRPTNFSPYNVTFSSGTSMETATLFYKSNPESIYKVSLYNGTSIKGTKDHPIMTMNGFKWLPNITTDDYVRVYYGQNVFGCKELDLRKVTDIVDSKFDSYRQSVKTNNFKVSRVKPGYGKVSYRWLNEHIARLLGYIVSEGTARGISNNDVLVLDDCQSALCHMFSENLIKRYEQGVGWDNTYIRMYLEELLGYEFKGSAKFEVPLCIRQATKSIQINFLSALFEGDGSAYADCIEYTSLSKDLVYQIHAMLLNIGIISRIKTKQTWASNGSDNQVSKTAYVLFIEGRNIELFHKEIGFQSKRKRSRVQKQIKRFNTRRRNMPFYYDKVPNDIKVEVLNIIRETKAELNQCPVRGSKSTVLGLQSVYGVSGIDKLKRSSSPNVAMTYPKIKFFLEPLLAYTFSERLTYRIKQCLSLCDEPYYYEKVTKVSQLKNKQVTYDVHIPNGHKFIANGILNHNSGKSAFFNLLVPYLTHKWVKVEKPVETLGLMSSSILIGTCTALTWAKAQELLYEPISNAIENSKWFQQYFQLLDDYEERTGIELYKFKDTFLSFNHKNLILNTSGPNKRTLRGSTRWLGLTDEIGWFPHGEDSDERERASANEVYISLDRSLKTVRKTGLKLLQNGYDNIPLAYGCSISSPSSYNDKIMELVRNFKGSKEVLVHQAPTWEMNPLFTKEDFAKEYRDDPIKAERDFGANPPMAENAWISDVKALDHLLVNRWAIDYQYDHFVNRSGVDMVFGKLRSTKAPPTCPPTVLTIDAGYSNNSFALAICATEERGANVLAVAEIAPRKGVTVINYTRTVKQLLYPLIKEFNVQAVGADRWNSLKLLQDIEEDMKVQTFQYSLRPTDFDLVYDYLMEDVPAVKLPKPEMDLGEIFVTQDYPHGFKYKPNSHLYHQFSTVNVDGRGSVEKGTGYTDDILRAVVLGIRTCVLEDTIVKYNLRGATKQTKYAIGARSGATQATSTSSSIGSKTASSGTSSFGSRG